MPTITKKQFEDYKKMCYDRDHGKLLTIDGLRLICESLNRNPEAIGKLFLKHSTEYCPRTNRTKHNYTTGRVILSVVYFHIIY